MGDHMLLPHKLLQAFADEEEAQEKDQHEKDPRCSGSVPNVKVAQSLLVDPEAHELSCVPRTALRHGIDGVNHFEGIKKAK